MVAQRLRFITNSKALGFSVIEMSKPVSALHEFLGRAMRDGSLLINKDLDIFAPTLTKKEDIEAYAEYKRVIQSQKLKSVDGKRKVNAWHLIVAVLFEPAAECAAYNDLTVKCLEAHCAGFLESMEDTHMKDLITGGKFSEGQVSNQT